MMMAMMITTLSLTNIEIPSNVNMMHEPRLLTMLSTISIHDCAALLLFQLLAFMFAFICGEEGTWKILGIMYISM